MSFLDIIKYVYDLYFKYGARSSKKVEHFHKCIANIINDIIIEKKLKSKYYVDIEVDIKSINESGKKRCDIVVFKNGIPHIIFPVKIIMTNYKKNKNNYWESITGEILHIKWANKDKDIKFIPINIFFKKTPQIKNGKIKKFEIITLKDIEIYNELVKRKIVYKTINYIVDIDHCNKEGEVYNKCPIFLEYENNNSIDKILNTLIN